MSFSGKGKGNVFNQRRLCNVDTSLSLVQSLSSLLIVMHVRLGCIMHNQFKGSCFVTRSHLPWLSTKSMMTLTLLSGNGFRVALCNEVR
jgi:hypothetical protein